MNIRINGLDLFLVAHLCQSIFQVCERVLDDSGGCIVVFRVDFRAVLLLVSLFDKGAHIDSPGRSIIGAPASQSRSLVVVFRIYQIVNVVGDFEFRHDGGFSCWVLGSCR